MSKFGCCNICKHKDEKYLATSSCNFCNNRECYEEDKNITYNIYTEKELLKKILMLLEEMLKNET